MQSKLQIDRHSSGQPSHFFQNMQLLFGDDPDPLFLEESWSLGIPAAVENLHRRRNGNADHERQRNAFQALDRLGTPITFVENREQAFESLLADRAASTASRYDSNWTPHDWVPADRLPQRWIPTGWTPLNMLDEEQTPELAEVPMTEARARLLLGVTESSKRQQIRSAYRHMVGQSHPDRLQRPSEAACRHANQLMATLNEAYGMLCAALLEDAA